MDVKFVLVLIFCIGVCVAEHCTGDNTTACANEICDDEYVPVCEKSICTCNPKPDPTACNDLDGCSEYWPSHHCNWKHRHCLNGHCQCVHGHGI